MDSHSHHLDLDETQFKWNKVQQKEGTHTLGMQDLNSRSQGQRGSVSPKISHARHTPMPKFAWLWNSLARKQQAPNAQGLKVPDCIVCYTARSVLYSHLIDWCYSTQGSELHPEKVSSLKVLHFWHLLSSHTLQAQKCYSHSGFLAKQFGGEGSPPDFM
jgi:hypothetical protein